MPRLRSSLARAVLSGSLLAGVAGLSAGPARADAVRLVATDAKGVTLQVTVGAWTLTPPGPDGRVRVGPLQDSHALGEPGRPALPAFAATLAIPPGARPTARVLASEGLQAREGVRLAIAGKPVFRDEGDPRLGLQPSVEPQAAIADGPWPLSSVQLAPSFAFRGRRFVQLEVRPFRYDESGARVSSPLSLTVRVDWNSPATSPMQLSGVAARDPQIDAALEGNVLNWEQGRGWRSAPTALERSGPGRSLLGTGPRAAAGALAFEENEPEVRVKLDESALYKLAFDDLSANGYPDGVPVSDVSVHRHEFLEGQVPPYGTVELPCEIEDANGNGSFDSGDAVWLWVRNWAERSGASLIQRYWGDAEVVFVTRKPGALRVAHRPGWNSVAGLTPLASFPWRRHFEKDIAQIMQFVSSEVDTNVGLWHWTQASLYYSRPDTIRFETNNLDTTHAATFTVRWVGRSLDQHNMWAAIRNVLNQATTVVDSALVAGKVAVVRSATVPGSVLTEGNTNFFRQWGKRAGSPPHTVTNSVAIVGLDWFEVEYWRQYAAIRDYVRFNSADASGDVQMQVTGFTGDSLRVYDITDPDQPVRVTIDPSHLLGAPGARSFEMQDVVAPGARRQYVAACQNAANPAQGPRVPAASAYSAVTRRNVWSALAGDYLMVVPEVFQSAVAPLTALRNSQGLSVLEAPVESIYDEFNGGRHSGAAIQRFTKFAYARWNSRFLLLVGDGTLDPNGVRPGSGKDWLPVLPTPGPVGPGEGLEIIPSDNRYGFITGNEDPISNPDTNRVVPELMVGRLTVNSAAEATTVVNKLVAYENVQPTDTWRKNVLLSADDAFSGETTFGGPQTTGYCHRYYEEYFVLLDNTMQGFIQSDSGVAGMNVEQFNLRYYLPNENIDTSGFDTCRVDRAETQQHTQGAATPALLGKLTSGQLLWNYQGHANEYLLTHENLFLSLGTGAGDESRIGNNNMPFIFTAFSCHANMYSRPEAQTGGAGPCLGETFLGMPNGRGAVGSWASVSYEVVPRNKFNHINVELIRSMFVNPPRDEFLGADDRGSRVVMGEVVLSALFRYLGTVQSYQSERGLSISYTLLGDPATRISIGKPLGHVLANNIPVSSGTPVQLRTLGDTLRIDADIVSNVRIDSLALFVNTGTGGDVPVPPAAYTVTPPLPDTGAASVNGGRHFKLVYRTQPAAITQNYAVVARDRNGLVQRTDVTLELAAVLRVGPTPIQDNDEVAPNAALSLLVLSPAPIANPQTDITLTLNGANLRFTEEAVAGDPSGREWVLSWAHPDYAIDDYTLVMSIQNGGSVTRRFRVTAGAAQLGLRDLFPFPNPFDNDGTRFSFVLLGTEPANIKIHVFSQNGKSIYTGVVRGLSPGYHQIAWDGHDAEGDELANGVYFYRVSVTAASGTTTQQLGKLVKLRKPKHQDETTVP